MDIILDIGGTKTRVGLVSVTHKLLETSFFLTNKNFDIGMKNILEFVRGKDIRVENICVGIAGVMDKAEGNLYSSPNMKGWIGKPIKRVLEKEFAVKVFIENDAALAGLGEAVYGAGKDYKIVSYFTISTGVGGARIVNKNIDERVYGFEPGHQFLCVGCNTKCCHPELGSGSFTFEKLVSGKSIKRIYGESPRIITDKNIWEKIIKNVAVGVSNSVYFWSPEIIVLGGGVALSDSFDIALLKKEVKKLIVKTYPTVPEFKKAVLGDFSGIWGGIAYLENLY